jgi:hypothetical protein
MIEIRDYSSVVSRRLGFIKKHQVRLSAGLVVVIGAIFIGVSPFMSRVIWIVSLTPLVLGACVSLLSSRWITDSVHGWEEELSSGVERARMSDKKEARYIERPLHGTGLAIYRMTGRVGSDHLKAGVRFAAILYVGMLVLALLAALLAAWLFAAAVTLAILAATWIFGSKDDEEAVSEPRIDRSAPIRGRFYRGSSWFTEEMAGRVDDDGIIYRGTSWITEERIGRVDSDGTIYKGSNMLNEERVGRIDRDGAVYKGSNWFTEGRAGRVTDDGTVYEGKGWLDEKRAGRVDKE